MTVGVDEIYDLIIIGGGVSGFGAAVYAGRFRMKTAVIAAMQGGAIINTNEVANYPGFKMLTGFELFNKIKEHALENDIDVFDDQVSNITKRDGGCFIVNLSDKEFYAKSIIVATGSEWRKLGISGEKEYASRGVHYCALCDGAFYKDKVVAVIGGSDTAVKDALILTEYASKVFIIYRKDELRAEPINLERLKDNNKIEVIYNTNITEIKGETSVNKVVLDNPYNGSDELHVDGVFVAIGHVPISTLVSPLGVEVNEKDEIIIDRQAKTNVEGIFAAGDVTNSKFKQAITGVAEGVTASYSAYVYVKNKDVSCDD